jgi:hypothetical protein
MDGFYVSFITQVEMIKTYMIHGTINEPVNNLLGLICTKRLNDMSVVNTSWNESVHVFKHLLTRHPTLLFRINNYTTKPTENKMNKVKRKQFSTKIGSCHALKAQGKRRCDTRANILFN